MKAALFLLSLWFCLFAVTDAIECYIDEADEAGKLATVSDCVACSYYYKESSSDHQCETKTERWCLYENSFSYIDSAGNKQFFNKTECTTVTPRCKHMLYICKTDKCNMACGSATNSTSSPTTPSTTTTTTTPSPTTTTSNHGSLERASLSVFGVISLIFAFIH